MISYSDRGWSPSLLLIGTLLLVTAGCSSTSNLDEDQASFQYDGAARQMSATLLEDDSFYEPDVERYDGGRWVTWLEFIPDEGDRLWVGQRSDNSWIDRQPLGDTPGTYVAPTVTRDPTGQLWLTYETKNDDGTWDLYVRRHLDGTRFSPPTRLNAGPGNDINHAAAPAPGGGLWVAWQGDRGGQFDILLRRVRLQDDGITSGGQRTVSDSPRGDWEPAVAVTSDGDVRVAWDAYDGESFDVYTRRYPVDERARPITVVAHGRSFQGRVSMAVDEDDRTWILWEKGSRNWGDNYIARDSSGAYHVNDRNGPLHRFRELKVARLHQNGDVMALRQSLPMPARQKAANRSPRRPGTKHLGVYYERGKLAVDEKNRLWVVYRHFYLPQVGIDEPLEHHVERGWRLYARHLQGTDWSQLYSMDIHQRDGLQRLSVTPLASGIAAAWATGRTDRRENPGPRGVALASITQDGNDGFDPDLLPAQPAVTVGDTPSPDSDPAPAQVDGEDYQLVMGDLHRHTDLSLCFPFFDGSIDDAYRYAIEVTELDFLGITDHTRDIDRGEALSQLWWRSTKEVQRHRLQDTFFPYFAFERSHQNTDHNVISLRDDMLRNYPPPLPEFWDKLEDSTITIPHAPFRGKVWEHHDDELRPLLEIYQGFRDRSTHQAAHEGLDKGYRMGFIASSDHLSTHRSYAGVWTRDQDRASIFQALKHRRTFGATDKIRLLFKSGDHWMGERYTTSERPSFEVEVDGTAEIASIDVYRDGTLVRSLSIADNDGSITTSFTPAEPLRGTHYFYVYLRQVDGNQAWSSPIWVTAKQPDS